jgi:hypothetical protein
MKPNSLPNSIGIPLIQEEDCYLLDITDLRVFTGLSILARNLGDQILDLIQNQPGDIAFLYKINPNINPELIDMKIHYIQVYSKRGVLEHIFTYKDEFQDHIRSVFGTFQRPIWGSVIHPEYYNSTHEKSKALIFPFHLHSDHEDIDYSFILERVEYPNQKEQYFFRITIEDHNESTLRAKQAQYVIVDDLGTRVYIEGSSKLADSISEKIQHASKKGHFQYTEENIIQSHIFEQIIKTGIGKIEQINFVWDSKFSKFMQSATNTMRVSSIKRVFLTLEDSTISSLLKKGDVVKIRIGNFYTYLYLTRLSKVLNISVNIGKRTLNLDHYLNRMPHLERVANKIESNLDFSNTKIFLIHHITSEILALIEVFRRLNVEDLNVMFVKYGGIVPTAYLDVLLDIPGSNFFSTSLIKSTTEEKKDYFTISRAYSDISQFSQLSEYLEESKLSFFEAMKFLSSYFFLLFCEKARKENKKVLLMEDGGYLSPYFQELAIKKESTQSIFKIHYLETDFSGGMDEYLHSIVIGSVEHTRNGYDRLLKVMKSHEKLFLPTYSIAISKNKVVEESGEVAHSILSAIESILHGQGMVLSRRKTLLLGSAGNIGTFLGNFLTNGRLHPGNTELIKIDLKYSEADSKSLCYNFLSQVPEDKFLSTELFLGVIGESILKKEWIEKLLIYGTQKKILFASGSTKTVEFSDLITFLNELSMLENPKIGDYHVRLFFDRIKDPQSSIDQGGIVKFILEKENQKIEKIFYLLSDLTPVNFLFYGVPTETMDIIIRQLTTVGLGMVAQFQTNRLPPPGLYAVDREIDEWGNQI